MGDRLDNRLRHRRTQVIGFFNHPQSPFPPFIECIMWFSFLALAIGMIILAIRAARQIDKLLK